jgi:hypothetical protein
MEDDVRREVKTVGDESVAIGGGTKDSTIIPGHHNFVGQNITQNYYFAEAESDDGLASTQRNRRDSGDGHGSPTPDRKTRSPSIPRTGSSPAANTT